MLSSDLYMHMLIDPQTLRCTHTHTHTQRGQKFLREKGTLICSITALSGQAWSSVLPILSRQMQEGTPNDHRHNIGSYYRFF